MRNGTPRLEGAPGTDGEAGSRQQVVPLGVGDLLGQPSTAGPGAAAREVAASGGLVLPSWAETASRGHRSASPGS